MNRIQNAGLTIERTNQARLMNEAHLVLESERSARFFSSIVFSVVVVILIGALITFFYIQRIHRRSHQNLKRIAKMREAFFTNITHEFRTPLTVILGLSQDMQNDSSDEGTAYAYQSVARYLEDKIAGGQLGLAKRQYHHLCIYAGRYISRICP